MKKINELIQLNTEETKHTDQFQEICEDLEKDFGKLVWTLPHRANINYSDYRLKEAGRIARERGIKTIPYLVGIMKKLP